MFVLFFFMVSIIVSNLIIGLTVSKTEELFREAGVKNEKKKLIAYGGRAAIAVRDKAQLLPTLLYKKRGGWIEPGLGSYHIRLYTALQLV